MTRREIAPLIDHTLLRPEATATDIRKLCEEARQYGFATVCVNPYWVELAVKELRDSPVKVCTVAGFPLGASALSAKVCEASVALQTGAREIDMVLNIGELRGANDEAVAGEILAVVAAARPYRAPYRAIVKVILETALLNEEQKLRACLLAKEAKADFVKTSTGFGPHGATVADVALLRSAVGPEMGVKASGGIRTLDDLKNMVSAGATRIGTSSGVKIIESVSD
jgi:deoxyribose-phosphate aldolase